MISAVSLAQQNVYKSQLHEVQATQNPKLNNNNKANVNFKGLGVVFGAGGTLLACIFGGGLYLLWQMYRAYDRR